MEVVIPKNSIPTSLQIILADMNFISQIQRNMKPCCNDRVLVDADSWSGAFYRFFKGESRLGVITKVEQIVNSAIEAIENQKYNEHISLTVNALNSSLSGIENLLFTYQNDPNMKARLNVQIENINIQLNRFRHLIKGYRPEDLVATLPNVDNTIIPRFVKEDVKEEGMSKSNSVPELTIDLLDSSSLEFEKKKKRPVIKK